MRDQYPEEDEEQMTITLTMDDGKEVECAVITILEMDDKEYIALLPLEEAEDEEDEIYIYQYLETEDGEIDLVYIDDDDEFDAISDVLDQYLEENEFLDLLDDDFEEDE